MVLKNDFFYINKITQSAENNAEFEIKFNSGHKIFAAHFPDYPIVPGVCEIQIVTECLSEILRQPFELKTIKNTKFSNPILLNNFQSVFYKTEWNKTENGLLQVKGNIFNSNTVFAKISLILCERSNF